jgi:hypothetical protein
MPRRAVRQHPYPRKQELDAARCTFEEKEPRDLFYKVATELVDSILRGATNKITLTEALAVLLQTWNKVYYQRNKFDAAHFQCIERALKVQKEALAGGQVPIRL